MGAKLRTLQPRTPLEDASDIISCSSNSSFNTPTGTFEFTEYELGSFGKFQPNAFKENIQNLNIQPRY